MLERMALQAFYLRQTGPLGKAYAFSDSGRMVILKPGAWGGI